MIDWMLDKAFKMAVFIMFCWCIAVMGLGVMAVSTVVYHVFNPECPTVFCFGE